MTPATIFGREPAVVIGAVQALIALAVGFGLDLSTEQVALILAAVTAVFAVVVRSQVTPTGATNERGASDLASALVCLIVGFLLGVIYLTQLR